MTEIEALVTKSRALFEHIDGLEGYATSVVMRNRAALGFALDADIYLGKYLWGVRRSELNPHDGFAALAIKVLSSGVEAP